MPEPRVFAEMRGMEEIQQALREVADLRELSRLTIDAAAGLAEGHASKLLAEQPQKRMGGKTLARLMRVLGVKLWMVEDEELVRRVTSRLQRRDGGAVRSRSSMPLKHRFEMSQKGRNGGLKGGAARAKKLRPWQRRAIARKAARRRWDESPRAVSEDPQKRKPKSAEKPT